MGSRPLTIEVAEARFTLWSDDRPVEYTLQPVPVPLDEARELSDRLLYGPRVCAWLRGGTCPRGVGMAAWTHFYGVTVRALIAAELVEAMDEAQILLRGRLADLHDHLPHLYRLRFGELCDHEIWVPGRQEQAA